MSTNPPCTVAAPSAGPASADHDRIVIFDTTLRDGEQSPGASMTVAEKLKIAELLEQMGVDVIEAGFAIASEGDFRAVHAIAKKVKDSVVCSLARAGRADIDRAAEALEPAARKRIHTFIATSPLHMAVKLQKTPEQVHEAVIDSVTHARRYCDDVNGPAKTARAPSTTFCAAASRPRSPPAPPRSTSRTRSATPTPRSSPI